MSSPAYKAQELYNSHDAAALASILTPDFKFITGDEGQFVMETEDYLKVYKDVCASFPDVHFGWSESNILDDGTVTSKLVVTGTNTGAPFGFGPFPPIEATGIKVENDPDYVEWIVEGDKVKQLKVIPTKGSSKTGPAGFYLQIGGKLE